MKKIITTLLLAASAISLAGAKSRNSSMAVIAHGTIGYNLGTSFDSDKASANGNFGGNMLFGGGLGFNYGIPALSGLGVQAEVNYKLNSVSTKSEASFVVSNTTVTTYSYSSIDVPLLATLSIGNFQLLAGPYISFPVSDLSWKSKSTTTAGSTTSSTDSDGTISAIDSPIFGLTFGGSWTKDLGAVNGFIGARYSLDFSPVSYTNKDLDATTKYFTRRGLDIDAGIKFYL